MYITAACFASVDGIIITYLKVIFNGADIRARKLTKVPGEIKLLRRQICVKLYRNTFEGVGIIPCVVHEFQGFKTVIIADYPVEIKNVQIAAVTFLANIYGRVQIRDDMNAVLQGVIAFEMRVCHGN